jgi:hypothetical protein
VRRRLGMPDQNAAPGTTSKSARRSR